MVAVLGLSLQRKFEEEFQRKSICLVLVKRNQEEKRGRGGVRKFCCQEEKMVDDVKVPQTEKIENFDVPSCRKELSRAEVANDEHSQRRTS